MAKGPAAPIDRPLSKAYLREFTGWSTAYAPGISDPTSLRIMENIVITQDGAAAVRPALRSVFEDDVFLDTSYGITAVGGFEPFFLQDGIKAILFAVRETIGTRDCVGFRVARYDSFTHRYEIMEIDDEEFGFSVPQGLEELPFSRYTKYVRYLQIDNKIFALSDAGEVMRLFTVGENRTARKLTRVRRPYYNNGDRLGVRHPSAEWIAGTQETIPDTETAGADTLISSDNSKNIYNFAFFYSFNTEIGESASSQVTQVKVQRRWGAWDTHAADDIRSPDQLVAHIPSAAWAEAVATGAISWNLYMLTWSNQDSVPVEGVLIRRRDIVEGDHEKEGWLSVTPLLEGEEATKELPNRVNRHNYTDPPTAGQGLVAADRMILVRDPENPARIVWSSNQQGNYSNLSSSVGGGFKTLTSGNLYVPATVKLWTNPQSVDTLTILCQGVDGRSTAYYMAPASVQGGSQAIQIMGFEETTATDGTVAPYGCEVLHNALYHPMDNELIKSTANNYRITHRPMAELIVNKWRGLLDKQWIISEQFDNKLVFIVNNPEGEEVPPGCLGNELWVMDTGLENAWSRWLIPAAALGKLEINNKLYLSVVKPDGIYILDELSGLDTVNNGFGETIEVGIPWRLETNTQGANRAHDAVAHLQLANITLGNFQGAIEWGIRGKDIHGMNIDVKKVTRDLDRIDPKSPQLPFDITDKLLIKRDMMEWYFYANSTDRLEEYSFGQISLVQYRYTPVTVNVGYEHGSVETFEYGRARESWGQGNTDNGIPRPQSDMQRP